MTSLMARGMELINRAIGRAARIQGVFAWPDGDSTIIDEDDGVVAGQSQQVSQAGPMRGDSVTRIGHTERVLLMPAASLKKNGVETLPQRGLRWTETINNAVCVFELMPTESLPNGWDWSDPSGRTRIRLVMKRVS